MRIPAKSSSPGLHTLILTLWDGEIHQSYPTDPKHIARRFSRTHYYGECLCFAFERSNADMTARGDRDLRIADMEKLVSEATESSAKAMERIATALKKYNDYIFCRGDFADSISRSGLPAAVDADTMAALRLAERRLAFLKNTINSDLFIKKDYDLVAKQYSVEIHKKYSIPFACLVFVLIGCPLGLLYVAGTLVFLRQSA
jgi:lipopolysaccharide export system permease protein